MDLEKLIESHGEAISATVLSMFESLHSNQSLNLNEKLYCFDELLIKSTEFFHRLLYSTVANGKKEIYDMILLKIELAQDYNLSKTPEE